MRAIVSSFGSAGDVRPLLGVAWALKRSGHEVVCLLDPGWCDRAERMLGVETVPFGDSWDAAEIATRPEWLDPKRGSGRVLRELVIPHGRAVVLAEHRRSEPVPRHAGPRDLSALDDPTWVDGGRQDDRPSR